MTMTETQITELEAAQLAIGRLATELERVRSEYETLRECRRADNFEAATLRERVRELEGTGAENKLKALAGQIESEQKRLDEIIARKKACRARLSELSDLAEAFQRQAIEITDDIG